MECTLKRNKSSETIYQLCKINTNFLIFFQKIIFIIGFGTCSYTMLQYMFRFCFYVLPTIELPDRIRGHINFFGSSAMSSRSFQNLFRTLIFGNSITVRNLLEFSKKIFSEFFFLSCQSSFVLELKKFMFPYSIRRSSIVHHRPF